MIGVSVIPSDWDEMPPCRLYWFRMMRLWFARPLEEERCPR